MYCSRCFLFIGFELVTKFAGETNEQLNGLIQLVLLNVEMFANVIQLIRNYPPIVSCKIPPKFAKKTTKELKNRNVISLFLKT